MFSYVIAGNDHVALPVKSDLLLSMFEDYVRDRSHKSATGEVVFFWGSLVIRNPRVFTVNDYANHLPALMGIL